MADNKTIQALVQVTPDELDIIRNSIGSSNVKPLVMADNGIAVYHTDGPDILSQLAEVILTPEARSIKDCDLLKPDTQHFVLAMAAGSISWPESRRLDYDYLENCLEHAPENIRADLLR